VHHHLIRFYFREQGENVADSFFAGNGVAGYRGNQVRTGNKIMAGYRSKGLKGPRIDSLNSTTSV